MEVSEFCPNPVCAGCGIHHQAGLCGNLDFILQLLEGNGFEKNSCAQGCDTW